MVRPQAARANGRAIAPASCLCSAGKGSQIKDPKYMSISTITVQTLTGPSVLLKELVQKHHAEFQDPDDIVFVDETTLQTTMYSGSGLSLLYLGDALAGKYPTLEIQSTEWFDCFEGVSLAHWKGGRRIYLCEMTEIVSCEVPGGLNWPIPDNRIRFWHDVPDLPLAI